MDGVVLCRADGDHRVVHISGDAVAAPTRPSSLAVAPGPWDLDGRPRSQSAAAAGGGAGDPHGYLSGWDAASDAWKLLPRCGDHEGNITGYLLYVLSKVRDLGSWPSGDPGRPGRLRTREEVLVSAQGLRTALQATVNSFSTPSPWSTFPRGAPFRRGRDAGALASSNEGPAGSGRFPSVAETSDLMEELGAWVIDRAVAQTARWEHVAAGWTTSRVGGECVSSTVDPLRHCRRTTSGPAPVQHSAGQSARRDR